VSVVDRRDFLKLGAMGTVAAAGLAIPLGPSVSAKSASRLSDRDFPRPYRTAFRRPRVLKPVPGGETWDDVGRTLLFSVTAMASTAAILPRLVTPVRGYNGLVPGPVIDVEQGVRTRLRVRNALPPTNPIGGGSFATSTHLHGSASLPQYDGYANDLTRPGQYKEYHFPNFQDARTLWYHDHGVHHTSPNIYGGLAATYHLHDEYERGQLPQGEFDVPLLVSDAMFAADGTLAYDDDDHSGLWGDVVLVNGAPWPVMKVKRRVYRFRLLNAAVARSFRFALSTREPLVIVATDGGLMPVPQPVAAFRQAPAERYEVLVDFSRYSPGTLVDLVNLSNDNNVDYDHTGKVMRFEVTDAAYGGEHNLVPSALETGAIGLHTMALTRADAKEKVSLRVHRDDRTNLWVINGKSWNDVVDSRFREVVAKPAIDEVQLWEFENRGGGWFHPMHIHLVDFRVVGRNTNGGKPFPWELGPKDVVYVGENETVQVLVHFAVPKGSTGGRYMVHCHNAPHEDHDMMVQYQVGDNDPENDPNDPIAAAPPVWDDLPPDKPEYRPAVALPGW